MTVAQATPRLSTVRVELQDILKVLNCLWEQLFCPKDTRDSIHGWNGPLVVPQSLFVSIHCTLQIAHQLSQASYRTRLLASAHWECGM